MSVVTVCEACGVEVRDDEVYLCEPCGRDGLCGECLDDHDCDRGDLDRDRLEGEKPPPRRVFAYRPTAEPGDYAAILYDENGDELGFHVSSSLSFAKRDIERYVPEGAEVVWCVGAAEWNAVAAGTTGRRVEPRPERSP